MFGFQQNLENLKKKGTELAGLENKIISHSLSLQRARESQNKSKPRQKDKMPGVVRKTRSTNKGMHITINTLYENLRNIQVMPQRSFKTEKRLFQDLKGTRRLLSLLNN